MEGAARRAVVVHQRFLAAVENDLGPVLDPVSQVLLHVVGNLGLRLVHDVLVDDIGLVANHVILDRTGVLGGIWLFFGRRGFGGGLGRGLLHRPLGPVRKRARIRCILCPNRLRAERERCRKN